MRTDPRQALRNAQTLSRTATIAILLCALFATALAAQDEPANRPGATLTPNLPGCGCLLPGPELVTNGSFDDGNSGFTSDASWVDLRQHNSGGFANNGYTITNNANNFYRLFAGTGNGNFLVIDSPQGASSNTNSSVAWQPSEPIRVSRNNSYCFSARFMTVSASRVATLELRIDGVALEREQLPTEVGDWVDFSAPWTSTSTGPIELQIVALNVQRAGHDFAIDDISFRACCRGVPEPDPSFTVERGQCSAPSVAVNANQVTRGVSHQWNVAEVDADGRRIGEWSEPCWGPNCDFSLEGGRCYEIRHGIYGACVDWTESRQTVCLPEVVDFGECCNDPELLSRIQCKPGEEFFRDECGCGCKKETSTCSDCPLQVTAQSNVHVGCDRKGAIIAGITLTIDGGEGPFDCEGREGELEPRDPAARTCVFRSVSPGTHDYVVTDLATGATSSIEVHVEDVFDLSFTPSSPTCPNASVTVNVLDDSPPFSNGPYTYRWSDPKMQVTPTATGLDEGTYSVLVSDGGGCYRSAEVTVSCNVAEPEEDPNQFDVQWMTIDISGGGRFPSGDFVTHVSFDGGAGVRLGYERFLLDRWSLDLSVIYTQFDLITSNNVAGFDQRVTQESSEEMLVLSAGANFHLLKERRADVSFGPFVSVLELPEIPGQESEESLGLGFAVEVEVPIGPRGWGLSGELRYIDAEMDLTDPLFGSRETLDIELLSLGFGLSKSF